VRGGGVWALRSGGGMGRAARSRGCFTRICAGSVRGAIVVQTVIHHAQVVSFGEAPDRFGFPVHRRHRAVEVQLKAVVEVQAGWCR